MTENPYNLFKQAYLSLLEETFENVNGYYLDKNTSLFETLSTINASEASIPIGGKCATLAAQVKHTSFYLEVLHPSLANKDNTPADWGEVWRTTSSVTDQEWEAIQLDLHSKYQVITSYFKNTTEINNADEYGMLIAIIAHTSYHLGEIRQALCFLKP